jgi:hypothetical protein
MQAQAMWGVVTNPDLDSILFSCTTLLSINVIDPHDVEYYRTVLMTTRVSGLKYSGVSGSGPGDLPLSAALGILCYSVSTTSLVWRTPICCHFHVTSITVKPGYLPTYQSVIRWEP